MNTPKRQHYIPGMILRNFTDNKGQLHCFYKPSGKIFSTVPDNVLAESHLYTQRDAHGKKDVSVEKELSRLEGLVQPVVEKIINAARMREKPELAPSEKRTWDAYFCSQLRRLPVARESLPDGELVTEYLDGFERELRPLKPAVREKFADPELKRELTHNAWVKVVADPQGELLEVLQNKGLAIAVIGNARESFVTGNNPTIRIAPQGRTDLRFPEVELLFPVAHDVLVTPGLPAGKECLIVLNDTGYIRQLNAEVLRQSDIIVGRSRALIESLSRQRWSRTPGTPP